MTTPDPQTRTVDVNDGGFGEAAYCHHRHHFLDDDGNRTGHSTDFDTCPHSICTAARDALLAPAPPQPLKLNITPEWIEKMAALEEEHGDITVIGAEVSAAPVPEGQTIGCHICAKSTHAKWHDLSTGEIINPVALLQFIDALKDGESKQRVMGWVMKITGIDWPIQSRERQP